MFRKMVGKRRESDALHNLRASDDFSKLMKDRNSEFFKNGVKGVNNLAQLYENLMIAFEMVI